MGFGTMAWNGWLHFGAAVIALATGGAVLLMRKGTGRHRAVGGVYTVAMLALNLSAFTLFGLTGQANMFHVFAVMSLGSLTAGMVGLWRWRRSRSPSHLLAHQYNMAFSYLGLWMAFVSELLTNRRFGLDYIQTLDQFWMVIAGANAAMLATGWWWIDRTLRPRRPATA